MTYMQATPSKGDKKEVQLLDMKRAYNVAIGLAQFKSFNGHENLFRAIVELDATNLNLERLQNLESMLPTPAELQIIKQYRGEGGLDRCGNHMQVPYQPTEAGTEWSDPYS
jgi:hypothetical protein